MDNPAPLILTVECVRMPMLVLRIPVRTALKECCGTRGRAKVSRIWRYSARSMGYTYVRTERRVRDIGAVSLTLVTFMGTRSGRVC